jgi:hypothetical protein
MSHQGNIRVVTEDGDVFLFTSGRWTGAEMPVAAREALRWSYSGDDDAAFDCQEFLAELIKNPAVQLPIVSIGNADVPTVEVDFKTLTVTWGETSGPSITMTFDDYIEADFDTVKAEGRLAEVFQERYFQ